MEDWHGQAGLGVLDSRYLKISSDLSDLSSASNARSNLGLGTMALETAANYYTAAQANALFRPLGTTIAVDNGGTGQTSYTNGQLLIGNSSGNTLTKATLTGTANQIVVTNGTGSITLSTPQNIDTAATVIFSSLSLSLAGTGLSVTQDAVVGGYVRVGSISAPTNTTAGDITSTRIFVGNGASVGTGNVIKIDAANVIVGEIAHLAIQSTDSQAMDKGGSIILGGYITNATTFEAFGGLGGRKENSTNTNTRGYLQLATNGSEKWRISSSGELISGGAGPSSGRANYKLAFVTTANIAVGLERMVTSNTAGVSLTIQSQGATSGATNKAAGNLILQTGLSTGLGIGQILLQATGNTAGSTSDNSLSTIATFDITGVALTTKITSYNNITTVSGGIPSELATIDTTGLTANVGASTLYAVPASGEGLYRVSAYVVETTAGSLSSTLPNIQIVFTDKDSNTSITIDATPVLGVAGIGQTGALTSNTVGTASSGVIVIYVKASTTIQYQTTNYASNLAGMTYAIRLKLEAL